MYSLLNFVAAFIKTVGREVLKILNNCLMPSKAMSSAFIGAAFENNSVMICDTNQPVFSILRTVHLAEDKSVLGQRHTSIFLFFGNLKEGKTMAVVNNV